MSDTPVLAELLPIANTTEQLYAVTSGNAVVGTVFCMNHDNINDLIRVALVPNGTSISGNSYICYDTLIYHGQSLYLQQIYLYSGDQIYVQSQNGTSNFILSGVSNPV